MIEFQRNFISMCLEIDTTHETWEKVRSNMNETLRLYINIINQQNKFISQLSNTIPIIS